MSLSVTKYGDNASVPFAGAETYIPDQLIAGDKKLVTTTMTLTGAASLKRGTVLGMVLEGKLTGTAVAASGNTGNGTIGSIAFYQDANVGVYSVEFTGASTYTVIDPRGVPLVATDAAKWGPNVDVPEIGFTFSAGVTPMAAGDEIQIVAGPAAVGTVKISKASASDGSEKPYCILVDNADASAGDVTCGVYLEGEFNSNAIIYDASWTTAQLTALFRPLGIHLKGQVSMSDPTSNTGGAMGGDAGGTLS